jgi:DNA repair exonuclease SbcCD nuclease subunit
MGEARQGGADWNVLMLHQSINGCRDGGWVCDDGLDPTEVCEGWDKVFAGHFHDYQTFGCCGEYVSAPMQHHFGDAGSNARGVSVVEFDKDEMREQRYSIEAPRFHVREWEGELPQRITNADMVHAGDYLRIDVPATHAEWKAKRDEVEEAVGAWREQGVHALDPKHVPILQHEDRLPVGDKVTDEEVLTKYLDLANLEGLDRDLLMQIGLATLQEVDNG